MSTSSANLGIKNIRSNLHHFHDLPRATTFYRDTLGLPIALTAHNLAFFFDCGGRAADARPR